MNSLDDESTFTLPLPLKAHEMAERFRQHQTNPQKAKQVYLNTLAVQAVNTYLEWMGIATDLETSASWNPLLQSLADVADLSIPHQGKLECRPVLPQAQVCYVPPEVWSDRIGYVAVQFDPDLTEATLLGFVPSVQTAELSLNHLQSLDELLDRLYEAPAAVVEERRSMIPTEGFTRLGRWLENLAEAGWQTVEELLGGPEPAFAFRGGTSAESLTTSVNEIVRGKPLSLNAGNGLQVLLLVGLVPTSAAERDIWVRLCPAKGQTHLPTELQLFVLDDSGEAVMQAQSRQTEMIQLRFGGYVGERFGIKVDLANQSWIEQFMI